MGDILSVSSIHLLTFSRCGLRQVWKLLSSVTCCARGAGNSRIICYHVLFCTDVVACVSLVRPTDPTNHTMHQSGKQ
jgi:hypothetical protein